MYPIIIHRLADLRPRDRIVARSGQRYGKPLQVLEALGPIEPGSPVVGVRVQNPNPGSRTEWVLYHLTDGRPGNWRWTGPELSIHNP